MDRRSFLKALIGLGAAVALPLQPTEEQVDEAWDRLLRRPFIFEVDEAGTIAEPERPAPRINRDIYRIDTARIRAPRELIDTVRGFPELESHFGALAASEREDAENQLARATLSRTERAALQRTVALIAYPASDWFTWVKAGGRKALPAFVGHIDDWLDQQVNWNAIEQWPRGWSGKGEALWFFQSMEDETLDALGVVIVEGDYTRQQLLRREVAAASRRRKSDGRGAGAALPVRDKARLTDLVTLTRLQYCPAQMSALAPASRRMCRRRLGKMIAWCSDVERRQESSIRHRDQEQLVDCEAAFRGHGHESDPDLHRVRRRCARDLHRCRDWGLTVSLRVRDFERHRAFLTRKVTRLGEF
jgi:hypothetical protein